MSLVCEARDYLAQQQQERGGQADLSPESQLWISCETMRLTARLTQVMAWLLVQKAVHSGELSRSEAAQPEHRLSGQTICEDVSQSDNAALQPKLAELLERSHRLYQRVARLDSALDGAA